MLFARASSDASTRDQRFSSLLTYWSMIVAEADEVEDFDGVALSASSSCRTGSTACSSDSATSTTGSHAPRDRKLRPHCRKKHRAPVLSISGVEERSSPSV